MRSTMRRRSPIRAQFSYRSSRRTLTHRFESNRSCFESELTMFVVHFIHSFDSITFVVSSNRLLRTPMRTTSTTTATTTRRYWSACHVSSRRRCHENKRIRHHRLELHHTSSSHPRSYRFDATRRVRVRVAASCCPTSPPPSTTPSCRHVDRR